MTTTAETATYLGIIDGWHHWDDGTFVPVLFGFDRDDEPGDDENEELEDPNQINDYKRARSARQAGRYRTQRNEARRERDELRKQVAFLRVAGPRFQDLDAAWKLADRALLVVSGSGEVTGADDAVAAVAEAHPFLVATAQDEPKVTEDDPFKSKPAAPRPSGKRTARSTYDMGALRQRYPALRDR